MVDGTTRRGFLLRGVLGGGAVTLGLPLLDAFLNDSGTAFAATMGGGRLPVRFGTWFWGCGMIPDRWQPKTVGADYDLPPQLAPIAKVKQHISVLTGFDVLLDGKGNLPHLSGNTAVRTGAPTDDWLGIRAPTLDVLIADAIGNGSFFRSLELSADGDARTSYSFRDGRSMNSATPNAVEFYRKIFGQDFNDPNKADFTPDPRIMVRRSVLSGVTEQRQALQKRLGASDKARLDQYFTSVREMEGKLALQLQKPPPAEACVVPQEAPAVSGDITDVDRRKNNHRLMAEMLAMALACNQTRVFNMTFSTAASDLRQAGQTTGYHQSTHEELIDRSIGYQPTVDFFAIRNMEAWADFVSALAAVKEGDGTLLDNMLVFAHSDVSYAKNHDVLGIPVMLAGKAGGKVKSGLHIQGGGETISRVGLTLQQVMGMPVDSWGLDAMNTKRPVSEILA
ncbi:DUF1552 domain-containing protein [Sphingobium sp. EP60837]|uniref:DUF1552 domain-containing protein n=1 Tax=Sphingobium sp. EP60837 TaxID=1855519 RepID=UPI0007DD85D7|nr:DUF1552 domain-containing protein [Sphingobium sp. EP60837]ANI80037.1 hypothetical protein EP837_03653 [Sphingobium sp. EP60837]